MFDDLSVCSLPIGLFLMMTHVMSNDLKIGGAGEKLLIAVFKNKLDNE